MAATALRSEADGLPLMVFVRCIVSKRHASDERWWIERHCRVIWLHSLSSPYLSNQTKMPACVKPNACSGQKDGPGCFYARSIHQWEYPCITRGVKAETLVSKKSFPQWCIRCFYSHPDNKDDRCKGDGCMKAMRDVKEKQEKMKMDASMSDSLETIAAPTAAASSNDPQQMIQKIQSLSNVVIVENIYP